MKSHNKVFFWSTLQRTDLKWRDTIKIISAKAFSLLERGCFVALAFRLVIQSFITASVFQSAEQMSDFATKLGCHRIKMKCSLESTGWNNRAPLPQLVSITSLSRWTDTLNACWWLKQCLLQLVLGPGVLASGYLEGPPWVEQWVECGNISTGRQQTNTSQKVVGSNHGAGKIFNRRTIIKMSLTSSPFVFWKKSCVRHYNVTAHKVNLNE